MKPTRSTDFDLEPQGGKGPNHEEEISGVHRKAHQCLPEGTDSKPTMQLMHPVLTRHQDAGTPYPISSQDMVLTKLVHVSKASFQPEILY